MSVACQRRPNLSPECRDLGPGWHIERNVITEVAEDRKPSDIPAAEAHRIPAPPRGRRKATTGLRGLLIPAVSATLAVLLALALGSCILALRASPKTLAPAATHAAPATRACHAIDLDAALTVDGGAGTFQGLIELRNRAQTPCMLQGYFTVAVIEPSGQELPPHDRRADGSSAPAPVTLPPGTATLGVLPRPTGHAYVTISWNDVLPPCRVARRFSLELPDGQSSIVLDAVVPGGAAGDVTVCADGRLTVTAVASMPQ